MSESINPPIAIDFTVKHMNANISKRRLFNDLIIYNIVSYNINYNSLIYTLISVLSVNNRESVSYIGL